MPTSVPVTPTITTAGLAAVFNDQDTGVEFALSHIAFGTGQYNPNGTETGLQAEKVRVPIAGGGRISATQIQIYAVAMAAAGDPFFVGEVGFFGDDGDTLLAVYSSTNPPSLFLSDTVATSVSYGLGLEALPANSVTVTIDPSASAALLIIGQHVASADPHPQYVEKVNGIAFYDPNITFVNGAQVIGDDLLVYQSIQANNIGHPPSSSPTWWVPLYNYGDSAVGGLAAANVTLTSTQAARAHITLSGNLTANVNVIFPNWVKEWTVVNETTGAFTLTAKTAAGTGVAIPQNGAPTEIYGDGTNITQPPKNIAPATASNQAVTLGQVVGVIGDSRNLVGTGTNTAIAFTADQIVVGTAIGGLLDLISNFNATFTLTASGLNGMDNGTAPSSGYVGIYAIKNPTTGASGTLGTAVAAGVVAPQIYSGSNPVSGYTRSALIGVVRIVAAGAMIETHIRGRAHVIGGAAVFGSTTISATPTQSSLAPTIIPANAKRFRGNVSIQFASAGITANLTVFGTGTQAGGKVASDTSSVNSQTSSWPIDFIILVPGSVWYTLSASSGVVNSALSCSEYDI
ncbi:phage tail protein [Paraburkholderia sp. SARCC-3016]|uniref:phage tail-collar fiber domain-containing protein n=1 Tax=Paraburkholderia sp. SARCC-3016 TaxID=3058611 RepID=UPI002808A845|nr:phage tail protein [Paraburkholderia sp. SARCC-3016]MDQ7977154.1 phage tail protein [Paraburkholderia sp. SARCC-3016]